MCFLNVNIFIVEHLNDLFKQIDLKDSEIQECLDACNFSFMDVNENTYKNYKRIINHIKMGAAAWPPRLWPGASGIQIIIKNMKEL